MDAVSFVVDGSFNLPANNKVLKIAFAILAQGYSANAFEFVSAVAFDFVSLITSDTSDDFFSVGALHTSIACTLTANGRPECIHACS